MAARIEPLLTVADLDACPDDNNRYELIEGELFVSGPPRLSHQLVLQFLQGTLGNYLESNPIGIVVPGAGAVFSEYDAVIPDLVVVRKERWDKIVANDRFVGAPDLAIEVLSPGSESRQRDLLVKRQLYAKYGVEEYWVVDVENRSVLIHRLVGQTLEETAILKDDDEITSPILPGFQLSTRSIFNIQEHQMVRRIVLTILVLLFVSFASGTALYAQTQGQGARKFDEFGDILMTDIKARLDAYAVELQNDPSAKGFILVYRSRRDLPGLSYRLAERMRDYLVNTRGVENERIIAVNGGEANCLSQELWIVPPGATPTPRTDAYQRNFADSDSAREFDELELGSDDSSANIDVNELEAYADALRAEPKARAYLIAYAGYNVQRVSYEEDGKQKRDSQVYRYPPGTAQRVLKQANNFLVRAYRVSPSRIRLVNGGYRKWGALELWIVPPGEHAPIATPNSFPPRRLRK